MSSNTLKECFKKHKENRLFGRYIFSDDIAPLIQKHSEHFKIEVIGASVLGASIYAITIGSGPKKILMWSQMHGNESTTTKAVFDLCNVFNESESKQTKKILTECTIVIIPMLNPDGAAAYTRLNANDIDLNRDAQDLSQPESLALRTFFNRFKPDFCFNLHGQRTIFSAGQVNFPATVSFLAPAQDAECTVTSTRKKAMRIIVKMNENLQKQIPNQVGIYDDAFNLNCVGDTFQSLNVPTVLFEAGHFAHDYKREVVREFIFQSLLVSIHHVATSDIDYDDYASYFKIPQNQKLYYDIIIRNASVDYKITDIAIQYQEVLKDKTLHFIPFVDKISDLKDFYGHKEVDANGHKVLTINNEDIFVGYENDFVLINNELFSMKLKNI